MESIYNACKTVSFSILILVISVNIVFAANGNKYSKSELNAESRTLNNPDPLRILLLTGGGPWHDYNVQKDQIRDGLLERISNVEITVDYEGAEAQTMASTDFFFTRHLKPDWAADFDVVIYNHCNLQVKDENYVKGIIAQHVKHQVPAVMLHCPVHLYQYAEGDAPMAWWNFTGAVSYYHEKENHPNTPPYTIQVLEPNHPIMVNYPKTWRTPKGELYLIVELNDDATPLSMAYSTETHSFHETAWTHEYEGVRVFTSTLGHHDESMGSDINLNLVASGVLWATGKLTHYGSPSQGYEGKRGLGWTTLWDDAGTMNGWVESGGVVDWTSRVWYGRISGWPTLNNTTVGKSFRLDGDHLTIEGEERNLFYSGRVAGGFFKNFELNADVYTYPGSSTSIYFHTRYKEDGNPTIGSEVIINSAGNKSGSTENVISVPSHKDNEWVSYQIVVYNNYVTVKANGTTLGTYTLDSYSKSMSSQGGTIGLHSAGSGSKVYIKNMLLKPLRD